MGNYYGAGPSGIILYDNTLFYNFNTSIFKIFIIIKLLFNENIIDFYNQLYIWKKNIFVILIDKIKYIPKL